MSAATSPIPYSVCSSLQESGSCPNLTCLGIWGHHGGQVPLYKLLLLHSYASTYERLFINKCFHSHDTIATKSGVVDHCECVGLPYMVVETQDPPAFVCNTSQYKYSDQCCDAPAGELGGEEEKQKKNKRGRERRREVGRGVERGREIKR